MQKVYSGSAAVERQTEPCKLSLYLLDDSVSPQERALARLAATGHLRIGEPHPNPYQVSPLPSSPTGTAKSLIDEDRADK